MKHGYDAEREGLLPEGDAARLAAALRELALANRVLHRQGVLDAFGHVSVRHPLAPRHFLLSRSLAPAQVTPTDILAFDEAGEPVLPTHLAVYLERFIHAAIYRARPDIQAVVHAHSTAMVTLGAVRGMSLRCLCHMGGFLGSGAPVFEIREEAGDATSLLITSNALGDALARRLGNSTVVLMRGHGGTVVGRSLPEAVFHAVHAESGARMQRDAMLLGEVTFLSDGEVVAAAAANARQIGRAWDVWVAEFAAAVGGE